MKVITQPSGLTETERIINQPNDEWLTEYDGIKPTRKAVSEIIFEHSSKSTAHKQSIFLESAKKAGIVSVKSLGDQLLITTDRHISIELDEGIKKNIRRLANIAEPATKEPLYEYTSYRTLLREYRPYLALVFRDIRTGEPAERFFNIILNKKNGEYFKTGIKGKFRVIGNTDRLTEGMFLKFWMTTTKQLPDDKPSHIDRYMRAWLSNVIVSCPNPETKHEIKRLKKVIYEGHLYQIT